MSCNKKCWNPRLCQLRAGFSESQHQSLHFATILSFTTGTDSGTVLSVGGNKICNKSVWQEPPALAPTHDGPQRLASRNRHGRWVCLSIRALFHYQHLPFSMSIHFFNYSCVPQNAKFFADSFSCCFYYCMWCCVFPVLVQLRGF